MTDAGVAVAPDPAAARRRVTVLGSTGSVGRNTLDLITRQPDRFAVEALTAGANVELLVEQARAFRPRMAVIGDPGRYAALKEGLAGTGVATAAGAEAVAEAASLPAEWVMAAIVGAAGLAPTLSAIRRGAVVALANKECLVCAGGLMMAEVSACGATLLPVDSEHNAIFQVFDSERPGAIERIILTASGGPFLDLDRAAMAEVTPAQAVAHPVWDMGPKISVDSASLMNKGLEIIEAHHLFDLPEDKIELLVHPQSVIHSMVAYIDGSVLAPAGDPGHANPDRARAGLARADAGTLGPARSRRGRQAHLCRARPRTLPRTPPGAPSLAKRGGGTYYPQRRERGGGTEFPVG